MEQNIWKRIYFDKPYAKPFLFYAVFGTDNTSKLTVSKSRHNIDGMPDGLEIINYDKSNAAHKNYIDGFFDGDFGKCLQQKSPALYEKAFDCNNITIIKGDFEDSDTLNYLKNSVGITQAVLETGAIAIFDIQIFEWFEPQEWSEKYFEPQAPNVFNHVKILFSENDNGIWFHTRGMRKFGRPDLSIRKVTHDKKELAIEIINRFIQAFAYGFIPDETHEIRLKTMEKGVYAKILGDYDDLDFNNYYFEINEL